MFTRVFLTVPSITIALHSALITQDEESIETSFQNLCEELSLLDNKLGISHPRLMEKAFNCIGKELFDLDSTTLSNCYNSPIISEEIIYHSTVLRMYKDRPIIISLAQEITSGGLIDQKKPGMMEQLYRIFLAFLRNYPSRLSENKFNNEILPYFAAHLSITPNLNVIHDGNGIEFQHGERATNDYLRLKETISDINKDVPYFYAFLDAQKYLFDKTLIEIKSLP